MPHDQITFIKSTWSQLDILQTFTVCLYAEDPNSDSKTTSRPPSIKLTMAEFERKPDKGSLISILEGTDLIGYAIIIFFWSNEYGGDVIEIDELYISPASRNRGVGSSFFTWLEIEYKDSARGLSLQVSPQNCQAVELYERLGFSLSPNKHLLKLRDACANQT